MDIKYDEKSCGIVLFRTENDQKHFLLLHYPGGHWDFPKGHVEAGETEHQTALRELEEETGITQVKLHPDYREFIAYKFWHNHKRIHKQVVFFLAETSEHEVEVSHEHQDHIWLNYDQALKKLTFDNAKELLIKAKKLL